MPIHLDHAGGSLMSMKTYQAAADHLRMEMASGGHVAARAASNSMQLFYSRAATVIGAKSADEIAFITSGSQGLNLIISGLQIKSGGSIVTLSTEFGANIIALSNKARQTGSVLKIIECERDGSFSMFTLEYELKNGASCVFMSHAAAQGSITNPIEAVGKLAAKYNVPFIVDACQSIGQLPIDVKACNCSALFACGRKWLRGPRGTGILYIKQGAPILPTQFDIASADLVDNNPLNIQTLPNARAFEYWEKSVGNLLGLSNALDEFYRTSNSGGLKGISKNANLLRDTIAGNEALVLVGAQDSPSGIVGFYLRDPTKEQAVEKLFSDNKIMISTLRPYFCPLSFPKGAGAIFRLSPHYLTKSNEISLVAKMLQQIEM